MFHVALKWMKKVRKFPTQRQRNREEGNQCFTWQKGIMSR